MASTNETPILKLPQFTSEDKPAWIGDFNSAMQKIDTGVGDNQGKIASVETVANEAKATADSADAAVTALGGEVSRVATEQDAQASEIDSLQNDVAGLQGQISTGLLNYEKITVYKKPSATSSPIVNTSFNMSIIKSGGVCVGVRVKRSGGGLGYAKPVGLNTEGQMVIGQVGYIKGNPLGLGASNWVADGFAYGVNFVHGGTSGGFLDFSGLVSIEGLCFVYDTTLNVTAILMTNIASNKIQSIFPSEFSTFGYEAIPTTAYHYSSDVATRDSLYGEE